MDDDYDTCCSALRNMGLSELDKPLQNPSNIMSALDEMRKDECLCDFTIKAGADSYPVHRSILAANSEYFKAMLSHSMRESEEGVVELRTLTSEAVRECVSFMYCRKSEVNAENAVDVLQGAHMFQLKPLINECFRVLIRHLTAENCIVMKNLSLVYDSKELEDKSNVFIMENFENLPEEYLLTITCHEMMHYVGIAHNQSFERGWSVMLAWINCDPRNKQYFKDLYAILDVKTCTFDFLLHTVLQNPLIRQLRRSRDLAEVTLFDKLDAKYGLITAGNWESLLQLPITCELLSHSFRCVIFEFVRENLGWISETDMFKNFTIKDIQMCIAERLYPDKGIFVSNSATHAWSAVLTWIKYDESSRTSHLTLLVEKFLEAIHTSKGVFGNILNPKFTTLFQTMVDEPLVRNSVECQCLIRDKIAGFITDGSLGLTVSNCLKYRLIFGDGLGGADCAAANESVDEFVRINCANVISSKEFLAQDFASVLRILPIFKKHAGTYVWKAIADWKRERLNLCRSELDLLNAIAFDSFSSVFLRKIVRPNYTENYPAYRLITEAIDVRDRKGKDCCIIFADRQLGAFVGYSPLRDTWVVLQAFQNQSYAHSSFIFTVQGRRVYAVMNNRLYRLNKSHEEPETWTELQRIPVELTSSLQAVKLNDEIYIMDKKFTLYFDTDRYCKQMSKWKRYARMDTDRVRAYSSLIADEENDILYCIGGLHDNLECDLVDKYSDGDDEWTEMCNMLIPRIQPAACVFIERIYVFGGEDDDGNALNSAEMYNLVHDSVWVKIKDMPYFLGNISACVLSNRIFVVGGEDNNSKLLLTEYDTTNPHQRWRTVSVQNVNRFKLAMAGVAIV